MMTRFTAGVVMLSWAACALYPLGLLLTTTPTDFAFLRTAFEVGDCGVTEWHPLVVMSGHLQYLERILALTALSLAGLGLGLLRAGWPQRWQVFREASVACGQICRAWRRLSAGQRQGLAIGLLVLSGLRLGLSFWLAPEDDACSYRLFVRQPLLLISSCYPIPNNHVLSNSISRVFYLLHPSFWWSMRLPVLLLGVVGTCGWYLLLLVRTTFRVAALAVGIFSCLQLSLYNSAQGRGYCLLLALSGLGFCTILALSAPRGSRGQQLPWVVLAIVGPLGLYTVPTFAYFLFSGYSWLVGWWLVRRAWGTLAQGGVLLGGTLLAATLLYAPLLLVSGVETLRHNRYVRPASDVAAYWRRLPAELWVMEGRLTVEKHVGGVLVLLVIALVLFKRNWRAAGRRLALPSALPLLSLWCTVSPYLLMVAQRVRAPERTLLYKSQIFFLLLALVIEQLLLRREAAGARRQVHWLWLLLSAWLLLQFMLLYRLNESVRAYGEPPGLAATHLPSTAVFLLHPNL